MIFYQDHLLEIGANHLNGFFEGWPNPPSTQTHLRILENSACFYLAIDDQTSQVVGFVTALTDGILFAYIPLLEVLPAYRGQGIGQVLVNLLAEKLKGLYSIDLLCDPDVQPFYEQIGFRKSVGMTHKNYACQSGSVKDN